MGFFDRFRPPADPIGGPPPEAIALRPLRVSTAAMPAAEMRVDEVMFCVLDVETTGLNPKHDRVAEIAVLRCDSRGEVVDEWHTLVDPQRPMDGEWIHGISDEMVAHAPTFEEVAPRVLDSLRGAVLVAHNAAFDRGFVEAELELAGHDLRLPYLCTMHMRRHVGLAAPVMHRLSWACWQSATPIGQAHAAVSDARAVVGLLNCYLQTAREAGHETLAQLALTAAAADACQRPVLIVDGQIQSGLRLVPRDAPAALPAASGVRGPEAVTAYQAAIGEAVEDFVLDGHEVDQLHELVIELGLSGEELREAHQGFIRDRLNQYLDDDELSWEEYEQLRILARLLALDGRWLEELVVDVRPRHIALTLESGNVLEPDGDDIDAALQAPLSVCFTGPFEAMPLTRREVQDLAADAGMIVRPGVSAKLDLLVCRDPFAGTGKLRKAEAQGTVIVDQETFLALAGAATPTPSPTAVVLNHVAARRRARVSGPRRPTGRTIADTSIKEVGATPSRVASLVPETHLLPPTIQVLWCETGSHEWTRPAQRGRPPKQCPAHYPTA